MRLVDELARVARDAEPPALDERAARQLVDGALARAARGERSSIEPVASIAHLAGTAQPPAIAEATARRLVDAALDGAHRGRAPRPRSRTLFEHGRSRWVLVGVGSFAAAACLVALGIASRSSGHREPVPELSQVALPTGDRLVEAAGAKFDIERLEPADRRLRLREGAILFDVAHVARGQRFVVTTKHLVATAKGTIFSVETDAKRTRVRVYEGIVEIARDERRMLIGPGASWDSETSTIVAAARSEVFAAEVTESIERRIATATATGAATATGTATATGAATGAATATTPSASVAAPTAVAATATIAATRAAAAPAERATATSVGSPVRDSGASPTVTPASSASTNDKVHANGSNDISRESSEAERGSNDSATTSAPSDLTASPEAMLVEARAAIGAGLFQRALTLADHIAKRGLSDGAWHLVIADALRGLGRTKEAANEFARAASKLSGEDAIEAGYSAAYLRYSVVDLDGALAALDASAVDAKDSPLEERGLALRVRALEALGRHKEARAVAARYLERFPHADMRALMLSLSRPR